MAPLLSPDTSVDTHVQSARAINYDYMMAYSTNGSSFTVDLSVFPAKKLHAWWYNPRNGKTYTNSAAETVRPFDVINNKRKKTFDPTGNPAEGNDWILVIDDANKFFRLPGSIIPSRSNPIGLITHWNELNIFIHS